MREIHRKEFQASGTYLEEIQEIPAEKTKKEAAAGEANHQFGSAQTEAPKEKGQRAWLTRNAVAFCTVFIGFFAVLHLFAWVQVNLSEFFLVPLLCALVSTPLILIRTDHWIMRLAGWFGALSGPLILLLELFGISPQGGKAGNFYWYILGIYFLDAIILGAMARRGALKNRSIVPRWEQKIRGYASRNTVALCNASIAFFLVFYCSRFFTPDAGRDWWFGDIVVYVLIGAAILLFLVSIPLILSNKGGGITTNAGWMGILYVPFIGLVNYLVEPSLTEIYISGWNGLILYVSIYTLIAILLAYFGRKKAKKERSQHEKSAR